MDTATRKMFAAKMRGNKSRLSVVSDKLLLFPISFLTIYIILRENSFASYISIFLACCAAILLWIVMRLLWEIRLDRYILAERKKQRQAMAKYELAMMPTAEFNAFVHSAYDSNFAQIVAVQKVAPLDVDTVLESIRMAQQTNKTTLCIVTIGSYDGAADAFCDKLALTVISGDTLSEKYLETYPILDAKVDETIAANAVQKKHKRKFFVQKQAQPYFALAIVLFVLSLFLRLAMLYRILGTICLWIALFFTAKGHNKK